jgi:hypothetical protein
MLFLVFCSLKTHCFRIMFKWIGIQRDQRCRSAQFNVVEALKAKRFDNQESEENVPLVAQSLCLMDDHEQKNR